MRVAGPGEAPPLSVTTSNRRAGPEPLTENGPFRSQFASGAAEAEIFLPENKDSQTITIHKLNYD